MRCEVCGSEIRGRPFYRIIEGGKMTVCGRCARFGSADWDPNQPRPQPRERTTPRRPRSEIEAAENLELVEDYGEKIRKAREKIKMTVEEFAKKIGEKESVVKKLEKGELSPDTGLVRKIRNSLGLELLVAGETSAVPATAKPTTGRTLGDIMKLSQPKPKEGEEKPEGELEERPSEH
jgi:putative transcription factor